MTYMVFFSYSVHTLYKIDMTVLIFVGLGHSVLSLSPATQDGGRISTNQQWGMFICIHVGCVSKHRVLQNLKTKGKYTFTAGWTQEICSVQSTSKPHGLSLNSVGHFSVFMHFQWYRYIIEHDKGSTGIIFLQVDMKFEYFNTAMV